MSYINSVNPYWGVPSNSGVLRAGSNNASFRIQEGQLDIQAKNFITKWDTDKNGVLDLNEFKKSDGLTGEVKTTIGSTELAQALWASIAGPDGTMSAAEYARTLLGLDENSDGTISQAESDKIKTQWAKQAASNPGKANVSIYNNLIALGTDIGLDRKFAQGSEEKYAQWLEEDNYNRTKKDTVSITDSANSLTDILDLLMKRPTNAGSNSKDTGLTLVGDGGIPVDTDPGFSDTVARTGVEKTQVKASDLETLPLVD